MRLHRTASSFGLACGVLPRGPLNTIADVPGVTVGHVTVRDGPARTGFTAIHPHPGNLFREKVPAAVEVVNGFGKTAGLVQLAEVGSIETPILLTNTLSISVGFEALVRRAIVANPDIGRETTTVNPIVCECNDGQINDIQSLGLTVRDAHTALDRAGATFEQGSVGAGTGMTAFGFKGGIGSASRLVELDGKAFNLGALVLANFGSVGDLVLPDGRRPVPLGAEAAAEKGSVIIVIACDIPMETRQLQRVARRAAAGLARLGSFWGHSSGDIAIAFSTAERILHDETRCLVERMVLRESAIDGPFRAAAEATQEAVLNAMINARPDRGRDGRHYPSLGDWLAADAGNQT